MTGPEWREHAGIHTKAPDPLLVLGLPGSVFVCMYSTYVRTYVRMYACIYKPRSSSEYNPSDVSASSQKHISEYTRKSCRTLN